MQTIYLDISNKGAIPTIHAKQGDVGRKFLAVINDSGVPHSLDSDDLFSVWYDGDSGEGNYSKIDGRSAFSVNGNKIVVELVTQMLTNPGKGVLSLVINDPTGQQIGLWNIDYVVEAVPGMDSPEADQYYTAFLDAIKEMTLVGVESSSFPGCYYRVVNGETEWLNPPMVSGVEYRTTERWCGQPVYAQIINIGTIPGGTYKNIIIPNTPSTRVIDLRGYSENDYMPTWEDNVAWGTKHVTLHAHYVQSNNSVCITVTNCGEYAIEGDNSFALVKYVKL